MTSMPPSIRCAPRDDGSGCSARPRNARGHDARVVDAPRVERADEPQLGGAQRAQQLLLARLGPRDEDCALVERQDFAERVVSGHRDDADRSLHQALDVRVERHDGEARQELRALAEPALHRRRHERTEHEDGSHRNVRIVLVGTQYPVDDRHAVVAAPHRDEHVR